jgi:hypothetical protein
MGLCVFLLICGPFTTLMFFPLTMRKQRFHLAPADVSQTSAGLTPATVKGFDALRWSPEWSPEADEHHRSRKNAA